MDVDAMNQARQWLAEAGVSQLGDNAWVDADEPERTLTTNELAHEWLDSVMLDTEQGAVGRMRLLLGFLDLLDDYWVTFHLRVAMKESESRAVAEVFWDGYRRRLEAPEPAEPVELSLRVDWFEDRDTVETAFAELLADDIDGLCGDAQIRRAQRVLECSGPVPWALKKSVYGKAAARPELHQALFRGIYAGCYGVYGSLDPSAALTILRRLELPEDYEGFDRLKAELNSRAR